MCFFLRLGTLLLCLDFSEIEMSITTSKRIDTALSVQFQQKCTKKDKPLETAPQQLSASSHRCGGKPGNHSVNGWKRCSFWNIML